MKVVIQCVDQASVTIDQEVFNAIKEGYLIYVGFTNGDTRDNVVQMVNKIAKLRINPDENGKINLNGIDAAKEILSISQFTLYANTKKGNRPSFTDALVPNEATLLYDYFNEEMQKAGFKLKTGVFGADMKISSINNGPLTFIVEN